MRILIVSCLLLICFGCSSNLDKVDKSHAQSILRIGHGGMGFHSILPWNPLPINSMSSLRQAMEEYNADGLEVDLRMTKDKKFVLYHDKDLSTTTSIDRCIELHNYEDLKQISYTLGFPFDLFQEEYILGLGDLIDYLHAFEDFPHLHIDLRVHSPCLDGDENYKLELAIHQHLEAILRAKKVPREKVIINTFSKDLLSRAASASDGYPLSYEVNENLEEGLDFALNYEIPYLTVKPEHLTKEFSRKARADGVRIITFGGNSAAGNRLMIEKEADIIQTNNLGALNGLLMPKK